MNTTQPVATRLPPDEVFLLEVEAERNGLTVSEWLRRAIREQLEREHTHPRPQEAAR